MKVIRNHLQVFYDELWQDLLGYHYGVIIKANTIKHKFSWTSPEKPLIKGFKNHKPKEFIFIDRLMTNFYSDQNIDFSLIKPADDRMLQGDYRYGYIYRQNLSKYNTNKEFYRRLDIAYKTSNLEYLVDAYNMIRIEYYKYKKFELVQFLIKKLCAAYNQSLRENWKLISVDDGIHAQEN